MGVNAWITTKGEDLKPEEVVKMKLFSYTGGNDRERVFTAGLDILAGLLSRDMEVPYSNIREGFRHDVVLEALLKGRVQAWVSDDGKYKFTIERDKKSI